MKTIGQRIAEERKKAGLTQAQLAAKLNVTPQNISQYERGVKNPKIETLDKIASALNIPLVRLYPNVTKAEYETTSEFEKLKKSVAILEGILAEIELQYGRVQLKELETEDGLWMPYYVIGEEPNTFIVFQGALEAIESAVKKSLPPLLEGLKDPRTEEEIIKVYGKDPHKLAIKVWEVRPLKDHKLWLRFSTGEAKEFDFTPLLDKPVFEPLADTETFNSVYIDRGMTVWNDGDIDISPEYLYVHSKALDSKENA